MCHLFTPHHGAGAELTAQGLLYALVERGHTVDVVLSQAHPAITETYQVDGITVHPRLDKGDPARWLSEPTRRPDVLITHLDCTERASILGGIYRVPVVHLLHNTHITAKLALARRPALVVANSEYVAADVSAWWDENQGGRLLPPMIVIPPPIQVADYRTKPGTHVTLINPTEAKGAGVFYALARRFPRVPFLAVQGGYGVQIRDDDDLPNVTWQAHVPGDRMTAQVYRRTKVLLMPSDYESYGRCAIEAACSGIPTLAHPTPGLLESLGAGGVFADRDDIDAWAAALRTLLSTAGWATASKAATARVEALHTDADLDRWATALEAIVPHAAPPR